METGLFEIQADYLRDLRQDRQVGPASREVVSALFGRAASIDAAPNRISDGTDAFPNGSCRPQFWGQYHAPIGWSVTDFTAI